MRISDWSSDVCSSDLEFARPVVIAGFEPLDVMQSILMLVRQINQGRAEVENQYQRAVSRHGNIDAKALVVEVFELRRSFEWRGLGTVPYSALKQIGRASWGESGCQDGLCAVVVVALK